MSSDAQSTPPSVVTSIRFTPAEKRQLATVARNQNTSVSDLIRGALVESGALSER